MQLPTIRPIAVCLFRDAGRILVEQGFDRVLETPFYRPLGGGIEPGETSAAAVAREVREEIGAETEDLRLLGVIENIFSLEGAPGHEIMFVYDGRLVDPAFYERETVHGREDDGVEIIATWRRVDSFDDHHRLVPPKLRELL